MLSATLALNEARSVHEQLQKLVNQPNASSAASSQDERVAAILGGAGAPRPAGSGPAAPTLTSVSGEIGALYAELDRADATPTSAQAAAITEIEKDFAVVKQWHQLVAITLPIWNGMLHSANLPELHLDSASSSADDDSDDLE